MTTIRQTPTEGSSTKEMPCNLQMCQGQRSQGKTEESRDQKRLKRHDKAK